MNEGRLEYFCTKRLLPVECVFRLSNVVWTTIRGYDNADTELNNTKNLIRCQCFNPYAYRTQRLSEMWVLSDLTILFLALTETKLQLGYKLLRTE